MSKAIATALDLDPESVYAKLANPALKEGTHIDVVRQADPAAAKKLEAQKLPGLTFLPEERRVYPAGTGTASSAPPTSTATDWPAREELRGAAQRRDGHEVFMQSGGRGQLTLSPASLDAPATAAGWSWRST